MQLAARFARFGNRIIDLVVAVLVLGMLLYGGYCLWDNHRINTQAFVSSDLLQYKPNPGDPEAQYGLKDLLAINEDVVGWITIDDTHIDYPMVQGETDMEYINMDVFGEFSLSGAIFLSCLNHPDFTDHYNLVYGHHMDSGAMFGDVVEFTESDYFNAHTSGTLYLPDDSSYEIQLFACLKTEASDQMVYRPQDQADSVQTLLDYLKEHAVQYRELGLSPQDKIIGLSTCSEAITNGRIVLFGRLVE